MRKDNRVSLQCRNQIWQSSERVKHQALVYDIIPLTTVITRKLSVSGQIFVGVQIAVGLYQTTELYQAFLL